MLTCATKPHWHPSHHLCLPAASQGTSVAFMLYAVCEWAPWCACVRLLRSHAGFGAYALGRHSNKKSGALAKRGQKVKSWKLRWFEMGGGVLKYFDCKGGKLKGGCRTELAKPCQCNLTILLLPPPPWSSSLSSARRRCRFHCCCYAGKLSLAPGSMVFEWQEGLKFLSRRKFCFCIQVCLPPVPRMRCYQIVKCHPHCLNSSCRQTANSRRLICQAASAEERKEWMEALMMHINGGRA